MSEKEKDLGKIDDLQIETLSDEELKSVAGGANLTDVASCMCCGAAQTVIKTNSA